MHGLRRLSIILASTIVSTTLLAVEPLIADQPVALPGPAGGFDFMAYDSSMGRIIAAHGGARSLAAIDSKTSKTFNSAEVGRTRGVAIDSRSHKYFLGGDNVVVIVDARSLEKVGEVAVEGPVDAIAFDQRNRRIYATKDDGDRVWVIDTMSDKLVGTIIVPGVPEALEYDALTNRLYLNIKDKNLLVRIDPATNKVESSWSTLPMTSPHGLALDSKRGRVYSAGSNGKLVAIDMKTGKLVSVVNIAPNVDLIAFDAKKQRIYSACRGFISVTGVTDAGLQAIGQVPSPAHAHSLAVDAKSHDVWVTYADDKHSYFQRFK